jgi:2,3-bisphosphoglycerate-dependent phosphoglycerate mutase
MKKLILLRHGESQWNLLNKFTGWTDVKLTKKGIQEAESAANKILNEKIEVESIYTSLLSRSIHTAKIVSNIINFPLDNIQYDWRLNERHYGALQGLNKSETAKKYGESQVKLWRRSYEVSPPKLSIDDKRHPRFNDKFNNLGQSLPVGESLKDVINRLNPFWVNYFNQKKFIEKNSLIVAHSNSLRAIIKILDKLNEEEIVSINIPTGVPLVYSLNDNLDIINKKYLIDDNELKKKQSLIASQGKAL